MTLLANDAENVSGMLRSDPNYSNSFLQFRSNGSFLIDLDHDDNGGGLHSFAISYAGSQILTMGESHGMVIQKPTGTNSVSEPHVSIRDIYSDGYGRLNIGNISSQKWQIAGKPTGTTKWLLFHLTDNEGNTGDDKMQLRGDGDLFLEGDYKKISDIKLKKNIVKITGALDRISQIGGYHYNWKNEEKSQSLQTGVIAQEIQSLFPELAEQNSNGSLSVNYDGIIPYLIESIKELVYRT